MPFLSIKKPEALDEGGVGEYMVAKSLGDTIRKSKGQLVAF